MAWPWHWPPGPGDDPLAPFLGRVSSAAPALPWHGLRPLAPLRGPRPRYEPRNLDFADGLDRWDLDTWHRHDPVRQGAADGEPNYAAAAEGPSADLFSAVPRPAWLAALVQAIYADDYRGATVTFSGEIRTDSLAGQAGLRLEITWYWRSGRREDHCLTIGGRRSAWTRYEITARIPADADLIRFGIGHAARSPRRSRRTPTPSCSASSWPAPAGSSCATRS